MVVAQPRHRGDRGGADRLLPRAPRELQVPDARSTSSRRCRATPPARSSSATCERRTGRGTTAHRLTARWRRALGWPVTATAAATSTGACARAGCAVTSPTGPTRRSWPSGCAPRPPSGRRGAACAAGLRASALRSCSGPAEDAPLVLRGKALRDAVILRLLAVERLVRGAAAGRPRVRRLQVRGRPGLPGAGLPRLPARSCARSPTAGRPPPGLRAGQAVRVGPAGPALHAARGRLGGPRLRRPAAARGHRPVADEAVGRVRRHGRHLDLHPAGGLRAAPHGHAVQARRPRAEPLRRPLPAVDQAALRLPRRQEAFEAERHGASLLEVERASVDAPRAR